jgi:leucine-rich repeat-containing protein 49
MLTFQHNQISKIENLISLPNLIYIDFFDNQIKEIENLSNAIPTLKVLLLPKNSIAKIKNIN